MAALVTATAGALWYMSNSNRDKAIRRRMMELWTDKSKPPGKQWLNVKRMPGDLDYSAAALKLAQQMWAKHQADIKSSGGTAKRKDTFDPRHDSIYVVPKDATVRISKDGRYIPNAGKWYSLTKPGFPNDKLTPKEFQKWYPGLFKTEKENIQTKENKAEAKELKDLKIKKDTDPYGDNWVQDDPKNKLTIRPNLIPEDQRVRYNEYGVQVSGPNMILNESDLNKFRRLGIEVGRNDGSGIKRNEIGDAEARILRNNDTGPFGTTEETKEFEQKNKGRSTVFTRHYQTGEQLGVMTRNERRAYEKEAGYGTANVKTFEGEMQKYGLTADDPRRETKYTSSRWRAEHNYME